MNILIVDDNADKINILRNIINELSIPNFTIDITKTCTEATQLLSTNVYDLLLLDLFLPVRPHENPKPEAGYNLLKDIIRSPFIKKPYHVLGLTEYEEIKVNHSELFENEGWQLLKFDRRDDGWINIIKNKIMYICPINLPENKKDKSCILILTAIGKEFNAVKANLSAVSPIYNEATGNIYDSGLYNGANIILAECGVGNIKSASETERLISQFNPAFSIFFGIGGGIKDVSIGDVVFGTKIYGIESGKDGDTYQARPNVRNASFRFEQTAKYIARDEAYIAELSNHFSSENIYSKKISIFAAPISSGEKVVTSRNSTTYNRIKDNANDSIVVAMEEIGFLESCHANSIEAIIIRSVSDLVDNKSVADNSGSQEFAVKTGTKVLFHFIETILNFNPNIKSNVT